MKRIMPAATIAVLFSAMLHLSLLADPPAKKPKADHLRMALVCLKCQTSAGSDPKANQQAIQANLERHFQFIDKLASEGADFIGFPELSLNGYQFSKTMTWLKLDGPEVKALQRKAVERKIYISVGMALEDKDGKRWNVQIVIDPVGRIIGVHRKIWLTAEKGYCEIGAEHNVFDVKGIKMGIVICADGTDRKNLQALVDMGAQLIYGPHANTTGGTLAGWYKFRSAWGGEKGWIAEMKIHAALHNHAGRYNPDFHPPKGKDTASNFASGAWFIAPDGRTLAQIPTSTNRADSKEYVLMHDIPIQNR